MAGVKAVNISPPNIIDVAMQSTSLATSDWYKKIIFYLIFGHFSIGMSSK
jgi:hypothetical protein